MSAVVDGRVEGMEVFNNYGAVARGTMVFTYALRVASWNVALHLGFARRIKKYNTKLECGYDFVK